MLRDLVDQDDGENRAVRSFLALYGANTVSVGAMKAHMRAYGWDNCWPTWAEPMEREHLTKGGAQHWLRFLFALEVV
jgi:hypothetical protein